VHRASEASGFARQRAQQAELVYFPDPVNVLQRMLSWVRPDEWWPLKGWILW